MSQLELHNSDVHDRKTFFVDVILPVPIPRMFTYRSSSDFVEHLQIGCRVVVQFGSRKIMTGVIGAIHETPPGKYEAKYLLDILDQEPVVNALQIDLFQWIANYYMCSLGEVLNIGLPSGLKLSSESRVQLYPGFDYFESAYDFSENEIMVLEILTKNDSLTYTEVSKALQVKNVFSLIKSLVQKDAVIIYEELKEKYKPKEQSRIRLAHKYVEKEALKVLFDTLAKRPQQEALLLAYMQHVPIYEQVQKNEEGIEKKILQAPGLSPSALTTLVKNEVFEEFKIIVSRFPAEDIPTRKISLTDIQNLAKTEILEGFNKKGVSLLHGITGSGKTEIYISLIQDALEGGSQVLYLLPEIALTTQIVNRLKKVFGNKVGIYHSKFSDNERVEVWNGILSGRYALVLGVRSSIFLPFENLGLIIVDEEHESSYKQYDPAPRYNARDVALYMGKKHHAKVLLGSATPSLETYYQAKKGKYNLVKLNERYGKAQLPEYMISNTLKEEKKKVLKGEFSTNLIDQIKNKLDQKEQAIIFQNRRGYSPYISCQQCAHIPKCNNCAVSLTYHQYKHQLICHYCGYHEPMPSSCEACGSKELKTIGVGTEKLEEELNLLFPEAKIQRMDLDTTRNKNSYERIIHDFENREIDILVGTQMVTKGLDFDHVSLVGVIDMDRMLHFPDFRAYERTFQLTTQVSGRAGRRNKKGMVVLQVRDTEQPILNDIIKNDYLNFYLKEIDERRTHRYPPFTRLIAITIKNKDKQKSLRTANRLSNLIKEQIGHERVLGPQEPFINKIRNEYLVDILIKLERSTIDLTKVKSLLQKASDEINNEKDLKSSKIVFDVDPY